LWAGWVFKVGSCGGKRGGESGVEDVEVYWMVDGDELE